MFFAQITSNIPPSITIPSFTIPIPTEWAAWLTAHAIALWFAARVAIKLLARYAGSNQFVDGALWLLEHVSFNKQVLPLADRAELRAPPKSVTAETEGVVTDKTPNGLPSEPPKTTNIIP